MTVLDIQVQSKVIGGVRYDVTPLAAGACLKMEVRAARLLMPIIGEAAAFAGRSAKRLDSEDLITVARMIDGVTEGMDDATVDYLCKNFAENSRAILMGKTLPLKDVFDEHFRGRPVECLEWIRFCLEVNLGPLVDWIAKHLNDAAPVRKESDPASP